MYVHIIKLFYGSFEYDCHELYQEVSIIIKVMKWDFSQRKFAVVKVLVSALRTICRQDLIIWMPAWERGCQFQSQLASSLESKLASIGRSQTVIQLCQVATLHAILSGSLIPNRRSRTRRWLESVSSKHQGLQDRPTGWLWSRHQPKLTVLASFEFFSLP